MEFFRELLGRFFRHVNRDNTPVEPSRKRRGEDDISGLHEPKVRCLDGPNFYGQNNIWVSRDYTPGCALDHMSRTQSRVGQVQIARWGQNGKENCVQYLHSSYNPVRSSEMDHQKNCATESVDEIQVLEEHNHRTGAISKRNKSTPKAGSTSCYNGASSSSPDVEVIDVSPPTKGSYGRKEVEVIKILQSPQVNKRDDNVIQIVKETASSSKDARSQRGTPFLRKPFKTLDPSPSVCASSTPIAFTSRRTSAHSSEQPEIEVLRSSNMSNGISPSHYRSQSSSISPQSFFKDRNTTLNNIKRAEDFQTYNQIFKLTYGMDRKLPYRIVSPNGLRSIDRDDASSPRTDNLIQVHHFPSPVERRIPQSLRTPSKESPSRDRINISVERVIDREPSTSATRQQSDDADLQYLGEVHTPRTQSIHGPGEDILEEILSKYARMNEQQKSEAAEKEKEIKLLEERNKQATKAHKLRKQMDLTEQIKEYLKVVEELEEEKEDEVPPLPELTSEMEAEIDKALSAHPDTVLATGFNLTIKGRDMRTLRPLAWLNDEVINFYMQLLIERGKADNYPSVYAFNTFFFPKLVGSGYDSLKRWTKKVDIFANDYLLVPVHRGMHWCMAIIDMKEKIIRYYDSMDGRFPQCMDALLNYLQKESLDKKKQPFDTTGWVKEHAEDIPQQNNGSDCGMFACMYAEYVSRGAPITFTQDDMPYFRRKVVYEILKVKLLT